MTTPTSQLNPELRGVQYLPPAPRPEITGQVHINGRTFETRELCDSLLGALILARLESFAAQQQLAESQREVATLKDEVRRTKGELQRVSKYYSESEVELRKTQGELHSAQANILGKRKKMQDMQDLFEKTQKHAEDTTKRRQIELAASRQAMRDLIQGSPQLESQRKG